MRGALRPYLTVGVAIVGAGLIVVTPVRPTLPAVQVHAVRLVDDETALVMGPSTIPIPTPGYLELAERLYLQPNGFTGSTLSLATPEGLYPVSGVKSLPLDTSVAQGQQALGIGLGQHPGTAADPTYVFGWSQSSTVSSLGMQDGLVDGRGDPVDLSTTHFILTGDPNNPNGGMLERFNVPIFGQDHPGAPALGITFSGATPDGVAPTDIYTNEYDGFADFPRYPINFLADLNAYLGILFQHTAYLSMTADQVAPQSATNPDGAILLPGSMDNPDVGPDGTEAATSTNYWMMPDENLPLLQWLTFLPFVGTPLYDLLEPDVRILVNLGYGSITDGWDPGPANIPTTFGLFPDMNWGDVLTALLQAVPQGVEAASAQLLSPDNWNFSNLTDNTFLEQLITLLNALDLTGTPVNSFSDLLNLHTFLELATNGLSANVGFPTSDASIFSSSPTDIVNSITGTISGDYATLLPVADTVNTLLTTFPELLTGFAADNLDNPLQGIGDAVAAGVGLIPFALIFGAGVPVVSALGGTLVNVANLLGLGELADTFDPGGAVP